MRVSDRGRFDPTRLAVARSSRRCGRLIRSRCASTRADSIDSRPAPSCATAIEAGQSPDVIWKSWEADLHPLPRAARAKYLIY
jgi:hypothetical protein